MGGDNVLMEWQKSDHYRKTLASGSDADPHPAERKRLCHSYERAREIAGPVFEEMSHSAQRYTLHGLPHVDELWLQLDLVVGDVYINPLEAFVLGCGFLFHDIAMGEVSAIEDVPETLGRSRWRDLIVATFIDVQDRWPTQAEIENPPDGIRRACRDRAIRDTHAIRGAGLVEGALALPSGGRWYIIEDAELRDTLGPLISQLAESHWWDADELVRRFGHRIGPPHGFPREWEIDPLVLACMLRAADATQIDSSRAPGPRLSMRNLDDESQEHWLFQTHLFPPRLVGEQLHYRTLRAFSDQDAAAWWRALAYLRGVDRELRKVDELLIEQKKKRLAARGAAGVDSPERFAAFFRVRDWQPVDIERQVTDLRTHLSALGEQVYGRKTAEVALQALIQNGQDAVRARRALEQNFRGEVVVTLERKGVDWFLKVHDDGVGMDEDIIRHALLGFGRSGWRSAMIRSKFPGLLSSGFRPTGTFGFGFCSVLMVADDIRVTSRRYDLAHGDARQLKFDDGLSERPMIRRLPDTPIAVPGTVVAARLKNDALASDGLLAGTKYDQLVELVERLVLGHDVTVVIEERALDRRRRHAHPPLDLAVASPEEVFDRLYPVRASFSKSQEHHAALARSSARRPLS